ncbi:MAG: hypothetical protein GY938_27575 [Ketobacter sp.]|nr:hypothetical protein [Ketobacter sp.]
MGVKAALLLLVSTLLMQGCDGDVEHYQSSWVHQALALQRQLDVNQPLHRATFIATHNSFNSTAYTTPQSYYDPNQVYSIGNQLRMDVRALELDVHSFYTYDVTTKSFYPELLLCHGTAQHIGCSPFDRPVGDGLEEIAAWLSEPDNTNEVLFIYIENHASQDDRFTLADLVMESLGDYLYLPEKQGCNAIPEDLSKADILAANKNIIIISDGCSGIALSQILFGGFENSEDSTGYPTVNLSELMPAPQCINNNVLFESSASFIRMQEDRTVLSNLVGAAGKKVTAAEVSNMIDCEINLLGMDKLSPHDGRLQAAIWSWAENEPVAASVFQCALHNSSGRFESESCYRTLRYACRDDASGEWFVSEDQGDWQQGQAVCGAMGLRFAVPFSGLDNGRLREAKQGLQEDDVWMHYRQQATGGWIAG